MRCKLLALTAPGGDKNELINGASENQDDRKRQRGAMRENSTTLFSIRGITLCRNAFLAIAQIGSIALARQAQQFSSCDSFQNIKVIDTNLGKESWGLNQKLRLPFFAVTASCGKDHTQKCYLPKNVIDI